MARGDGSTRTSEPGITRHKGKLGTTYRVRVSHTNPATGERDVKSDTFDSFKEARDYKRRTIHELRAGIYQEPCTDPVSMILAHWLETAKLEPNSRRAYERAIRLAINPAIGSIALSQLTGRHVQNLYNEPRGESYATQIQSALHGALDLAVREGLVQRNVADGLRVAHTEDEDIIEAPIWTPDELDRFLIATSDHPLTDLFHVAAHTGLRLSELANLRWTDITLDLARLVVRRSKTTAGERRVTLDQDTVERLRDLQVNQEIRREQCGPAWKEHGRVFDRGDGRPVSPRTVEAYMQRTVARLKLPYATPHSLRHIHATYLLRAGVPLHVVQRRLGHASSATTATIYGHALPADEREAAAAFQQSLRQNRDKIPNTQRKTAIQ